MTSDVTETRYRGLGFAAHPTGLTTLYFTELWERFSYYGMRALLILFMVAPVEAGGLGFNTPNAGSIYGSYTMAVYLLAVPGGFIADRMLGAKRSVLFGGLAIAAGHYALAIPTLTTFYLGLILIAFGTGLFKPNISALVGALYSHDDLRRDSGFSLFYMGINIGAFIAPIVTGFLAQSAMFKGWLAAAGFDPALSWHWGFAAAGIGMTISMLLFARNMRGLNNPDPVPLSLEPTFKREGFYIALATLGLLVLALLSDVSGFRWLRWLFILVPLACVLYGASQTNPDARRLAAVGIYFIAAMIFWAIFEQAGTTLSLFADQLTRNDIAGFAFPSAWFQSANPIFVILLTPLIAALWLKLGAQQPSAPAKFGLALVFLAAGFLLMIPAASYAAEARVSPFWLIGLYFLFTIGELLLSPVGLATMTRIAPERMTGIVLGFWFLAAALGNKLAGDIGGAFTASDPDTLVLSFLAQAGIVAAAAALMFALVPVAKRLSEGDN
ncbi:amino acid/peptide transporter [Hyphomicrobium denitrificans 1NES1]|uniref:Amino acid/peptide transporter n=1 Tax=Hyphomicrobium denitrificans 1NES1 TaxID=670307 RepID=N0BH79_9HYPH|nr:peptide MFS transporter [Hyphomicrobium denitrificans]AGK59480.1 amino acid/peptide transporter [Hyphomicrobium denitrificans 1NES1]